LADTDVRYSGPKTEARPGVRTLSPTEASLRGRIGAYVSHSRHDASETTANARAAFLSQFERTVDPDGVLPARERARRARAARSAHFARLAYQRWRADRSDGQATVTEGASQ
jgi:hypothetical protein